MSFRPQGIIVPIVTPLAANGALDENAYRRLVRHLADNGVHGIFPFGTTGEFYAFSNEVYRRLLELSKEAAPEGMHVYAGANHITTQGAVEMARIAEDVGVDALSVLTPMFISQTQEELYAYYRTIAEATSLPVIIYNNKPKTNVHVTPQTVRELAKLPGIVAIKDSTGDMTNTEEYIRLTRDLKDFCVLMGRDTLIYAALCYGATGAIASCANVAPRIAVDIYEQFRLGHHQAALEAQFKLAQLRIATNMGTFPVVIKEALGMLRLDVGSCVPPIAPLSRDARIQLETVLREIGLLPNDTGCMPQEAFLTAGNTQQ